jgi:hypothetical protein
MDQNQPPPSKVLKFPLRHVVSDQSGNKSYRLFVTPPHGSLPPEKEAAIRFASALQEIHGDVQEIRRTLFKLLTLLGDRLP